MSIFSFLRGPRRPAAEPTQLTRTEAAARCAQAVRRRNLFPLVYAPRGDGGRVAVRLVLATRPPQELGWIEVPLSGAIDLHLNDSAVAAEVGVEVSRAIQRAFQGLTVLPVAADARLATHNGLTVRQAATGVWTIATGDGEARATADTFEDAVALATQAPSGAAPRGQSTVQVTMEPAYAARWIAHALRDQGHSAWVDGAAILLGSAGRLRVEITPGGPRFPHDCPEPERTLISAALDAVRVVDRLD
jgi:hypothetical protein